MTSLLLEVVVVSCRRRANYIAFMYVYIVEVQAKTTLSY